MYSAPCFLEGLKYEKIITSHFNSILDLGFFKKSPCSISKNHPSFIQDAMNFKQSHVQTCKQAHKSTHTPPPPPLSAIESFQLHCTHFAGTAKPSIIYMNCLDSFLPGHRKAQTIKMEKFLLSLLLCSSIFFSSFREDSSQDCSNYILN